MAECFTKINQEFFSTIESLWKNIGYTQEEIKDKTSLYLNDIRDVYEAYIENEQETMELMVEKLEFYKKSVKKLENELNLKLADEYTFLRDRLEEEDARTSSRRKSMHIQANTLLEEQRLYKQLADALKIIRDDRLDWFKTMKATENKLCNLLDKSITDSLVNPSLDEAELDKLDDRIKKLVKEKDARINYLRQLELDVKKIIMDHKLELHKTSSLNYLDVFRVFTAEDFENRILSDDKIGKYRQSFENLKIRKDQLTKAIDDKCKELKELCDILKVDRSEIIIFDQPMYHVDFLAILENEVTRLSEIKKKKLGSLTLELKKEINDLWGKCFYTDEEKKNFELDDCQIINDRNYDFHLKYLQLLKDSYKRHQCIFDIVNDWKTTWEEHIKFEIEYSDPNRFKKKDYRSLFEQQERQRINERLTSLKKLLNNEAKINEQDAEKQNLILKFLNYIKNVEDKHLQLKKEERENKKASLKIEFGSSQKNKPSLNKFSSSSKLQIGKTSASKYLITSSGGNKKHSYTPTFSNTGSSSSKRIHSSNINIKPACDSHSAQKTPTVQVNNGSARSKPIASRKIDYNGLQVPTIKITYAGGKNGKRRSSKEVRNALFGRIKKRKSNTGKLNSSFKSNNELSKKLNNLAILTNNENISSINASSNTADHGIFSDYITETELSCSLVNDLKQLNQILIKNN